MIDFKNPAPQYHGFRYHMMGKWSGVPAWLQYRGVMHESGSRPVVTGRNVKRFGPSSEAAIDHAVPAPQIYSRPQ